MAQQVRRGRGNHSGPAVRGLGAGDRAIGARAGRFGDRVLHRFERRRTRRLSAEAPARSDVNRIVDYSASIGKKSFAALLPDNAYGNVVEAAFKQAVGRKGRIVAFEKYASDRSGAARTVAQSLLRRTRCSSPMTANRSWRRRMPCRGRCESGQHPVARHRAVGQSARLCEPALQGGLYAAPDPSGFPRSPAATAPNTAPTRSHRHAGL